MKQTAGGNSEPPGRHTDQKESLILPGLAVCLLSDLGSRRTSGRRKFPPAAKGMSSTTRQSREGGSPQETPSSSALFRHLPPIKLTPSNCTAHENKVQDGLHMADTFWILTCDTQYKSINHRDVQGRFPASTHASTIGLPNPGHV